jgi:hypothetical protein
MAPANDPYISVVVTARNDNHGENMLGRMQASLDSWIEQAQRYDIPSEIIVVEWNPPRDRPPLKEALRWPASTSPCTVRFVEVPPEVHDSIPHNKAIHLHQMIGKNVGIRRARGQFVLATNIDIIYSAQLMQFFARRCLERDAFYRIDRHDVAKDFPSGLSLDQLLAYCRSHIVQVSAREGSWKTNGDYIRPVDPRDIVTEDSGIRLGAGWFGTERHHTGIKRYLGPVAEVEFTRSGPVEMVFDVEPGTSAIEGWVELTAIDDAGAERASVKVEGRASLRLTIPEGVNYGKFRLAVRHGDVPLLEDPRMLNLRAFRIAWSDPVYHPMPVWKWTVEEQTPAVHWPGSALPSPYAAYMKNPAYLHTNACGDFTMLAREDWFKVRAYPEFPIWPMHVDSLFCYTAYHAGLREVILDVPMRLYHIEHGAAQGATPEGEKELQDRVSRKGIPIIDYPSLIQYFHEMRRFNMPLIFCEENWGLADHSLPESVL